MRNITNLFICFVITIVYSSCANADWFLSPAVNILIQKADAGDADAQFRVGTAYDSGRGAPRSGEKAMKYYLLAAEQGHAEAQNSVGSGLQAEEKFSEALKWYERAADQGHPRAINNLAYLYDMGLGVRQDRHKGFELYSKAADMGWAEAMWNLANMYGAGQLGAKDFLMACIWSMRAQRFLGKNETLNEHLSKVLPYLERTLDPVDFTNCKQQGSSWSPQSTVELPFHFTSDIPR